MDEQQRKAAAMESAGAVGTEKAERGEQWIVTFGENGEISKIEKVHSQSGDRQELSEEEYAAAAGWDLSGASDYSSYYGSEMERMEGYPDYTFYPTGYEEAYYQGMSDAMEAVYGSMGMTPEEMAYYQGMEDYMTYCM